MLGDESAFFPDQRFVILAEPVFMAFQVEVFRLTIEIGERLTEALDGGASEPIEDRLNLLDGAVPGDSPDLDLEPAETAAPNTGLCRLIPGEYPGSVPASAVARVESEGGEI